MYESKLAGQGRPVVAPPVFRPNAARRHSSSRRPAATTR
jgi:hypothetical protein